MHRLLFLLSLVLLPGAAAGADLHADGSIDTRIGLSSKWDVVVRTRARVVAKDNYWYDVSINPVFRYKAHPRVTLYAGAFFTWYDFPSRGWTNIYRPLVGVEPTLIKRKRLTLTSRTGFERFLETGQLGDFNRYRQRFRIQGTGKWIPYANVESFFLNSGVLSTRYGGGVRRDLHGNTGIEISYFYEARDFTGPGVRHMISTTLLLNFKGLAPRF
jgi:hypothetical protein